MGNKFCSKFGSKPKNTHNTLTHFPKDPNCDICNSCKSTRQHCTKGPHGEPDALPEPNKFADAITGDHKVLNEDDVLSKMGIPLQSVNAKVIGDYINKTNKKAAIKYTFSKLD